MWSVGLDDPWRDRIQPTDLSPDDLQFDDLEFDDLQSEDLQSEDLQSDDPVRLKENEMNARIARLHSLWLLCSLCLLAFPAIARAANEPTAEGLSKTCEGFRAESKPTLDKAFCRGYMIGWRAGLEGAQIPDDKGVLQMVTFASDINQGDMAKQFLLYMDNHPEEKDALPKIALMHAMVSGSLVKLTPAEKVDVKTK